MVISNTLTPNTVVASAPLNTNFQTDIRDKFNAAINGSTGHTHDGTTGNGAPIVLQNASPSSTRQLGSSGGILQVHDGSAVRTMCTLNSTQTLTNKTLTSPTINGGTLSSVVIDGGSGSLPPIGSIIAHYDFNAAISVDTNYWRYCNGATLSYASSPIDGQTLPDLSGRYLVGFGNDGAGNIGFATWSTSLVGNASHQVNLQHLHTVDSHVHTLNSHTHTVASHTHGPGSLLFSNGYFIQNSTLNFYNDGGVNATWDFPMTQVNTYNGSGASVYAVTSPAFSASIYTGQADDGNPPSGVTGAATPATGGPSTANTSATSPGTDNQLSTTQSIQPRSIRVRYIMRVL